MKHDASVRHRKAEFSLPPGEPACWRCHLRSPCYLRERDHAAAVTSATTIPSWYRYERRHAEHGEARNRPNTGTDPAAFLPAGLCRVPPPDAGASGRSSGSRGDSAEREAGGAGAGSFAFPASLLAAAGWEPLGSRREKDRISEGEKSLRGAVYYLTLSFSYTERDLLAQRFNLV